MGEFVTKVNNVSFLDAHMFDMDRYNGSYIIDANGTICMIDTGMTKQWDAVVEGLEELGHKPADIKYIFCTHTEHNYSGGNAYRVVAENPDVVIYANPMDARELTNPELELARRKTSWTSDSKREQLGIPERVPVKNIRMFEDGEVIDINGYKIECIYAPGHQPGNSAYYDPQNKLMFLGDLVGCYFPDLDVMYPLLPDGANFVTQLESLKKMQGYDIDWIAVAHCGFSNDPEVLNKAIAMYSSYLEMGKEKVEGGKIDELADAYMEMFTVPLETVRNSTNIGRGEPLYNYATGDHLPPQAKRFQKHCVELYFPDLVKQEA